MIALDCLTEQANGLGQALVFRRPNSSRDECFGPDLQRRSKISRRFLLDGRFLFGREL